MEELKIILTPEILALVPVVAMILQVIKAIKALEKIKQWFPLLSIGVSLGLCYVTKMADPVLPSIIIGLVASGGYDLLKSKANGA